MPRTQRIQYRGAHFHVMARGNDGREIFVTDQTWKMFLATLGEACEQNGWWVHDTYIGKQRKRPEWLVRNKVFGSWGLKEGVNGTLKTYQTELERRMRFEQDPDAGRRGEFENQVKRGWDLGSREFRGKLSERLDYAEKGDNYRGAQRRAHNEDAAEALLRQGLDVVGLKETDLSSLARNDLRIQGLAWLIKTQTSVTGVWLSQRLSMGHLSNISRALARFRSGKEQKVKKMKKI